jgi:elongation factor G
VVPVAEAALAVPGLAALAEDARRVLVEALADYDDALAEVYLDAAEAAGGVAEVEPAALVAALRRVVCSRRPTHPDYRVVAVGAAADEVELGAESSGEPECVVVPCLMGASLKGLGVEALLDAIVALLPAPADRPPPKLLPFLSADGKGAKEAHAKAAAAVLATGENDPLCALAFKVSQDVHRGALVYARVYAGSLEKGQVTHASLS